MENKGRLRFARLFQKFLTFDVAIIALISLCFSSLAYSQWSSFRRQFVFTGLGQNDYFGQAVTGAGDFDGDGYQDFIIGAPEQRSWTPQASTGGYIQIRSSRTGKILASNTPEFYTGESPNFGWAIAKVGDFNRDGRSDYAVGAPTAGFPGTLPQAGIVILFTQENRYVFEGHEAYGNFGRIVASAGDLDHDGIEDLLIGAPNENQNHGRLYIVHIGSDFHETKISGHNFSSFPLAAASAGDVNGDGKVDIIASDYSVPNRVRLFYGDNSPDHLDVEHPLAFNGLSEVVALSTAGDLNHDGFSDVLVGAPWEGTLASGEVRAFFGSTNGLDVRPLTIPGLSRNSMFGWSVAAAGDVNCDGYPDILIGAPGGAIWGDTNAIGHAYLYSFNRTSGTFSQLAQFESNELGDGFGISVAAQRTLVNSKRATDIIIGAKFADVSSPAQVNNGKTYIYRTQCPDVAIADPWP